MQGLKAVIGHREPRHQGLCTARGRPKVTSALMLAQKPAGHAKMNEAKSLAPNLDSLLPNLDLVIPRPRPELLEADIRKGLGVVDRILLSSDTDFWSRSFLLTNFYEYG